jgi:hypothetical protein
MAAGPRERANACRFRQLSYRHAQPSTSLETEKTLRCFHRLANRRSSRCQAFVHDGIDFAVVAYLG